MAEVQNIKTRGLWLISIEFLEEKEDYRFKTLATDRPLFSNSSPSCKYACLGFLCLREILQKDSGANTILETLKVSKLCR